jgi:hypothetical protein
MVVILDNNTVAHQTKSSMMIRDRFRFVTKLITVLALVIIKLESYKARKLSPCVWFWRA